MCYLGKKQYKVQLLRRSTNVMVHSRLHKSYSLYSLTQAVGPSTFLHK